MNLQKLLICIFLIHLTIAKAQTKEEALKITKEYDLEAIQAKEIELRNKQALKKQKALEVAKIKNWPEFKKNKNGSMQELIEVTPDGFPIYIANNNLDAAKSTRTNHLQSGGSLGLNLEGQGMVARVWETEAVRSTHESFGNRITRIDNANVTDFSNSDHATHVLGTILGDNIASSTVIKGMAPKATARVYSSNGDEAEALAETRGGMLVSNHSYGVTYDNLPSWYIGAYVEGAKDWDEITYLADYYLPVMSAGNEGESNINQNPIATGYDKITRYKTAKNILIVANGRDATIDANGNLTSVAINTGSSQGPTDDGRIKPDITGNGTSVKSSLNDSDTHTGSKTGSSMASANVMGTLLLLQQHYKNVTGGFMKAATLKGLACHTSDDAGEVGPDPSFGWGLLNAKKAVETINGNSFNSLILEKKLITNEVASYKVKSNGTLPLIASITWTDVPGTANNGNLPINNTTPVLVNDLDIRITKDGTTYFPWKLNLSTMKAVRTGDNNVDNIELIKIDAPAAGEYTITVSHKGTLVNTKQNYSLIVTGIASAFSINAVALEKETCNTDTTVLSFNYKHSGNIASLFSVTGLPSGVNAVLNHSSLNQDGVVTITLSGLANTPAREYNIGLIGDNGTETETAFTKLKVYTNTFESTTIQFPTNNHLSIAKNTSLQWNSNTNAKKYRIEIATNATLNPILHTFVETSFSKTLLGLAPETEYFWKVTPINDCGEGTNTTIYKFKTGKLECNNNFIATDFTSAAISSGYYSAATVPVTVTGGLTVGDLNVKVKIDHTDISHLNISLKGPEAIGSPEIVLFNKSCDNDNNIDCVFDDNGLEMECKSTAPTIRELVIPIKALTIFNQLNADGIWTLKVVDAYNGNSGSIKAFELNICKLTESTLSENDFDFSSVVVYPNPTNGKLIVNLPTISTNTFLILYDMQGRKIISKTPTSNSEILSLENLQEGVYVLSIQNEDKKFLKKIVLDK